jgi:hypothetical protein
MDPVTSTVTDPTSIDITFSASDADSGISYYQSCSTTDGTTCTPDTSGTNKSLSGVNTYRVCARSIDVAGNVGAISCSAVGGYEIELNYVWSELMQGYYYNDSLEEYDSFHYYMPRD